MKKLKFMPHQKKSLDDTEPFNRVAYYLDMGLGKTFVGAEKMYKLNNALNFVICQKSKIDDWVQHFKEYYPNYRVFNLTKKSESITFRNLIEAKPRDNSIGLSDLIKFYKSEGLTVINESNVDSDFDDEY